MFNDFELDSSRKGLWFGQCPKLLEPENA